MTGTRLRGDETAQRAIESLRAEKVLERVHDDRAFAVVEVGLIGDARRRNFRLIVRAAAEVAIELELERAADLAGSIALVEHEQFGVARQRLDDRAGAGDDGGRDG